MACNVLSSIDCAIEIKVENCVVEFSEVTQVLDSILLISFYSSD